MENLTAGILRLVRELNSPSNPEIGSKTSFSNRLLGNALDFTIRKGRFIGNAAHLKLTSMDIQTDHHSPFSPESILTRPKRGSENEGRPLPISDPRDQSSELPMILCRNCRFPVTRSSDRIEVAAAHRHTFANPNGYLFEIGCFREAEGCATSGRRTDEFTWFKGYSWQIVICRNCRAHLGWLFQSSVDRFYGLILDHLIES